MHYCVAVSSVSDIRKGYFRGTVEAFAAPPLLPQDWLLWAAIENFLSPFFPLVTGKNTHHALCAISECRVCGAKVTS